MMKQFLKIIKSAEIADLKISYTCETSRRVCFAFSELDKDETQVYYIHPDGVVVEHYDIRQRKHSKLLVELLAETWYNLSDSEKHKAKTILKLHHDRMSRIWELKYSDSANNKYDAILHGNY